MKNFFKAAFFCLFFLCTTTILHARAEKSVSLRISPDDKRFPTFLLALELVQKRNAKTLVETGTARSGKMGCVGDGCSTVIFSDWAKKQQAVLYSVDIDPTAISKSKRAVRNSPYVNFFIMDSITFLSQFDKTIDFLYLDSYDFDFNDPLPSQMHHLNEIIAAYPHLGDHSIILLDDCDLPHGGKGKLVVQYLLERGWHILMEKYQILLVKTL